jgi:glycyl-tRNA synthetase
VEKVRPGKPYNVGLDSAIIMNPQTWVTSAMWAASPTRSWTAGLPHPPPGGQAHRGRRRARRGHDLRTDDRLIREHQIACPPAAAQFHRYPQVNLMFKPLSASPRRQERGLSAPGDGQASSSLRQHPAHHPPQAASACARSQELPKRDHPGNFLFRSGV